MKVRPDIGAALAAGLADEQVLDVGQLDIIGPSVTADRDRVAAMKVLARDQDAAHDLLEARAFASVCASPGAAVDALLRCAEAEAETLIRAHLPVVTALIDQLVEHGTLSGEQVDEIISGAVAAEIVAAEHQRRRKRRRRP
jgi:hypothetical protein